MMRTLGILALSISSAVALASCGGDDGRPESSASRTADGQATTTNARPAASEEQRSSSRSSRRGGVSVKVMRSRYGSMLFDGRDRALYLFTRDRTSSRCYGECASAWPPFLTGGRPRAATGAKSRLIDTSKRRDGKTQVTYRNHPLYYYVGDRKPGQVLCQSVVEFGGTWLVVSPGGRAVR
jgi:predicted lipoprotein with Yx(FWY)xxD motif